MQLQHGQDLNLQGLCAYNFSVASYILRGFLFSRRRSAIGINLQIRVGFDINAALAVTPIQEVGTKVLGLLIKGHQFDRNAEKVHRLADQAATASGQRQMAKGELTSSAKEVVTGQQRNSP